MTMRTAVVFCGDHRSVPGAICPQSPLEKQHWPESALLESDGGFRLNCSQANDPVSELGNQLANVLDDGDYWPWLAFPTLPETFPESLVVRLRSGRYLTITTIIPDGPELPNWYNAFASRAVRHVGTPLC